MTTTGGASCTAPRPARRPLRAVDTGWQDRGACRGMDTEMFYPDAERRARADTASLAAYWTCRGCRVRQVCLEYALETDQRHGIWGGTSPEQRLRLRTFGGDVPVPGPRPDDDLLGPDRPRAS